MRELTILTVSIGIPLAAAWAASTEDQAAVCPMHAAHEARATASAAHHHDEVDERHDQATGVAHSDSVHHFTTQERGGTIQLEVTDSGNTAGRDRIRTHLARIAADFAAGRFDLPTQIHDQVPPGVDTMRRLASVIRYTYSATPRGGRVEIRTDDAEARAAIHRFLRFQIEEHRTGDGG